MSDADANCSARVVVVVDKASAEGLCSLTFTTALVLFTFFVGVLETDRHTHREKKRLMI